MTGTVRHYRPPAWLTQRFALSGEPLPEAFGRAADATAEVRDAQ